MLQINQITKAFGAETVLENISFVINPGERVGLAGPNGCGKTTLLTIIAGEVKADSGTISIADGARLGILPQGLKLDTGQTVSQIMRGAVPSWEEARRDVQDLARGMAGLQGEAQTLAVDAYGEALETFERLGGYAVEHKIAAVLDGLGLGQASLEKQVSELSGGQRTRVGLAKVLLTEPDILLLDEPTNHLDIEALAWLEDFLSRFPGAALIVSHDRVFLDETVTKIIAIDEETHQAKEYRGNYSAYAAAAARELAKTWEEFRDQQEEVRRMRQDIHKTKMQAESVELTTTSRQPNIRRYAKKVAKKAKSREKKLDRYLDSEERVEKPKKGWEMKLSFEESMRSGQIVLEIQGLGHGYGDGPVLFVDLGATITYGERIALLGPNGSGKTTLLKIITGNLSPRAGKVRVGESVKIGYMPQEQETLDPAATPVSVVQSAKPMSETEARNFLHYFLFAGDGALLPVEKLSYGERARLILAKLVVQGSNFLVLDEPVNHLDIPSRERFEAALEAFPGTVLAAVHDRAFIQNFSNTIWRLEGGRLNTV